MKTKQTQNLVSLFLDQALQKGDAPFLWRKQDGEWQSVSWAEAATQIGSLAEALQQLGIKPGDRVGFLPISPMASPTIAMCWKIPAPVQ